MLKFILDAYSYCDDYCTGFNIICITLMIISILATVTVFIVWEINFGVLRFILVTSTIGALPVFLYWNSINTQEKRSK